MTEHSGRNTEDAAPASRPADALSPQAAVRRRRDEAVALPSIPGFGAGKGDSEPGPADPREALEQAFRRLVEIVAGGEGCPAGT